MGGLEWIGDHCVVREQEEQCSIQSLLGAVMVSRTRRRLRVGSLCFVLILGLRAACAVQESTGSVGSVAVSRGLSSCSLHPVAHQ